MFKIIQFTKKLKKVKTYEDIIIYYVFSTSNHQFSIRFPNKNVLKSNLKTDAGIYIPQISEKWANWSKTCPKEGPQIHQKSMKIQPWSLMHPLCWPLGPLDRKNDDLGSQKWVPRVKNQPKNVNKNTFQTWNYIPFCSAAAGLPILPVLQILPVMQFNSWLITGGAGGRGEALGYEKKIQKNVTATIHERVPEYKWKRTQETGILSHVRDSTRNIIQ